MTNTFITLSAGLTLALSLFPAHAQDAFVLVSQATGRCITLRSPNEFDGGGLAMKECAKGPQFQLKAVLGNTPFMFFVSAGRIICFAATENPDIRPDGSKPAVGTKDCSTAFDSPSLWTPRTSSSFLSGNPVQIEKGKRFGSTVDPTGFCLQESIDSSEVELDVCQEIPTQKWVQKKL
jgi:hypothetical protein